MSNCHGARRRIKKKIGMGIGSQTARHFSLGPVALWEKVQLVKNYKRKRIETENGNRKQPRWARAREITQLDG